MGNHAALPKPSAATRGDHRPDWVATILARPLFSQSRRPRPLVAAAEAAPSGGNDLPRLAGILMAPTGNAAIFAATGGGKPAVVKEGGHIGTFVIESIGLGHVTVRGPGGSSVLRPSFEVSAAPRVPVAPALSTKMSDAGQMSRGAQP
jgi:hypothetical protein